MYFKDPANPHNKRTMNPTPHRSEIRTLLGVAACAALAVGPGLTTRAADRFWNAGTASYTNAANWTGGVVPGSLDNAINDNGTNNVVQINAGDPDWTVSQIRGGNSLGNGAFAQNGATVRTLGTNYNGPVISEFFTPFRLGVVAADTGVYTLNDGTLNYGTGPLHVGEVGTGILNINGGTLTGSGVFTVNSGGIAVPNPAVLTATAGHGPYLGDYTYFEQGYSTTAPTKGLPPAGTTIVSVTQSDHSYTFAPSYTANNAVILDAAVPTATITLSTPTALAGLSFMGSAGNGPVTNNYTVHYASGANDTGVLIVPDWFGSGQEVLNVEARVDGRGLNFQYPGTAGGNPVGNAPYLLAADIYLVNTDKVVSIDLSYVGGNGNSFATATIMGVSGLAVGGSTFDPLAISGYNADVVIEAGAPSPVVASTVLDVVNQTGGTNTVGQLWVAQGKNAHAVYNLHGGAVNSTDWEVIGRSGGYGIMNIDGGVLTHTSGGQPAFIIGSGAGDNSVSNSVGILNQSGGTINCNSEYWLGENTLTVATNNISSNAVVNINSWLSIGRGGVGVINMTGGALNKNGNGAFIVGDGGNGIFNQSGGTNITDGELWVGNSGSGHFGTVNISGGLLVANNWFQVGRGAATATLNFSGGTIHKTTGVGGNFIIGDNNNGTVIQTGGTFIDDADYWIGNNGTGLLDLNNGTVTVGGTVYVGLGSGNGTMNLNGGTFTAGEIAGGGASSTVNFNGGTLAAHGDNANFMHDVTSANLRTNGMIIDSQGFNVTLSQALADYGEGGGVTKLGSGTVNFTGYNYYTGPTVVSAGKLNVAANSGGGSFTVADGATLGVVTPYLNAQLTATSLTLGTAGASSLDLDMGLFGNNSSALVGVSGTLTVNGTVTVNVPNGAFSVGTIPLISYASKAGSGTLATGVLPPGVSGYVTNDVLNNTVELVVTAAAAPRWDGTVNGDWDFATANWVDIVTANPAVYQDGNPVVFNDSALGTTSINVATNVNPSSMVFTNDALNYTLTGHKIGGSTGLLKQGTGTVIIGNTNDFTGPVTIQGGTLVVSNLANGGSPSALGASSSASANLVLANGTLSYVGPATAINRGYRVQSTNSTIDVQNNLALSGLVTATPGSGSAKTGPAQLTYTGVGVNELSGGPQPGYNVVQGTVVFDGSGGGQTNHNQNEFWVGGTPAYGASLILTNTTLNVDSWFGVGRGNGTVGNVSSVTLYNSALNVGNMSIGWDNGIVGNLASQFLTLNGSSTITNRGDQNLGESGGSSATIHINDNSVLWCQNRCYIGLNANATGTVAIANSGKMVINNGWFSIGNGDNGNGSLSLKDNASVYVSSDFNITDTGLSIGSLTLQGNAVASGNAVYVGKSGGSTGTVTMSGGTFVARGGDFRVGSDGNATFNQTGGTAIVTNWGVIGRNSGSVGVYNLSGGSFIKVNSGSRVNVGENGTGTLNVSGTGALVVKNGQLDVTSGGGSGTINLNGGSITAPQVTHVGSGTATFNFNGGTLIAGSGANANFMNGLTAANVLANGAIIDSGANVINIGQALLDGTGGGGLTKLGSGTLRLNGANTYTGLTVVSNGVLGGTGSIAGSVTVVTGAALAPGASVGTLTVGGNLTLNGNLVIEVDKSLAQSNDMANVTGTLTSSGAGTVTVTNLGTNAIVVGDKFTLFNKPLTGGGSLTVVGSGVTWINNLAVDGSITAQSSAVSTTPVSLGSTVSGGNVSLTWPADHTGWRLEVQTNSLSSGLGTNWVTWPNSTGTNAVSIPVNPTNPSVFFRLVYP